MNGRERGDRELTRLSALRLFLLCLDSLGSCGPRWASLKHKQLEKHIFFIENRKDHYKKWESTSKIEHIIFQAVPAATERWVSCVDATAPAPARRRPPRCRCLCPGAPAFGCLLLHLLLLCCSQTLALLLKVPAPSEFLPEHPQSPPASSGPRCWTGAGAAVEPGSAFAGK